MFTLSISEVSDKSYHAKFTAACHLDKKLMHNTERGDKIHLKILCDEGSALPITHISLSSTISLQNISCPGKTSS
jgi:hypothetical protein